MGAKQAKSPDEAGASPLSARCRRTPTRERGNDVRASLVLRAGERLARAGPPPPYQRRVGMIQDMMLLAKQGKHDEATEMLKTLRQVRQSYCSRALNAQGCLYYTSQQLGDDNNNTGRRKKWIGFYTVHCRLTTVMKKKEY